MATKLSGSGNISQYRDPNPKFWGIKCSHGTQVQGGDMIVKQMGNKYHPGKNVVQGRDFSIMSKINGTVVFERKIDYRYGGRKKGTRVYISVVQGN